MGSHCVTPKILTRLVCRHLRRVLLKVTVFQMSSERGGRDKPTATILYYSILSISRFRHLGRVVQSGAKITQGLCEIKKQI